MASFEYHSKPYLDDPSINKIPGKHKLPKDFPIDIDNVHQYGEKSYTNNSDTFILRVKSLQPYCGKLLNFGELCDLLINESNQQVFDEMYNKNGKIYKDTSMKDMCDQMRKRVGNAHKISLYLRSDSNKKILFEYDPKETPEASAASPFRPRRRSKSAKKRRNLKSKSKSKSKKRSPKPRRR
jgi:hypothetical protein